MAGEGNGKSVKQDIVLWIIAGILFALAFGGIWYVERPKKAASPKIVLLGDSIYATARGQDAVSDQISEKLSLQIFNASLGGSSLARSDAERWMDHTMDGMSMISLTKAILSGDFSVQRQTRIRVPATEYFDEVVDDLSQVDFDKVEILLLGYGMNDYQNGVPLVNPENAMDEYSFSGALRGALSALRERYPSLRVILLSPTYSWYVAKEKDCEQQDWGGGNLERYVSCERELAKEFGVEFIDLYHDLYEHDDFEDWKSHTVDGVHPNEMGRALLAGRIAEYLEEHP